MRPLFGALLVAICTGRAHAQPVQTGPQPVPPITVGEPALNQQLDGRRAVRGCMTGAICDRPGDTLKEFEHEAFPAPGHDPWISERTPAGSKLEATPAKIVKKPSELRPDAPWLDSLDLPDLPVKWSKTLVDYLVFYHDDPRGRAIMNSWLVAQGRYRDMILSYLRKAHLPSDLLYVAMIESGYDPQDTSTAGALGLWQFMPEGGRIYGLREDRWVDERRDPYRSTIAQMDYFADLQQRFGDWHIALAAFNMGYGAMLRSIARYNTNDFYQLCEYENGIPWETCLYTPKVLATAIVGKNRAAFKFDGVKEMPAEKWDDVSVPTSMSLAVIARAAGSTEDAIKRLNPHLRHGRTPPGETAYVVRVPAGAKPQFATKLAELSSDWDGLDAYVVAHGERFEDVATTYGITLAALKKLNDVHHESEIAGGTVVVVPRITAEQRAKNVAKAKSKLLGSGIDQKDNEQLIVPVPDKDAKVAGKKRVFYRVVTGDTIKTIAKAFGVTSAVLVGWNGLEDDANLHPKMVLVAWVDPKFDAERAKVRLLDDADLIVVTRGSAEHLDLAESRTGRVRTEYVATGKEKLGDIAKRYGMGSHDLARINRISYDTVLTKGQKIIVYAVTDPSRSPRAAEQWGKTPRYMRGKTGGAKATGTASVAPADAADSDEDAADTDPADDVDDDALKAPSTPAPVPTSPSKGVPHAEMPVPKPGQVVASAAGAADQDAPVTTPSSSSSSSSIGAKATVVADATVDTRDSMPLEEPVAKKPAPDDATTAAKKKKSDDGTASKKSDDADSASKSKHTSDDATASKKSGDADSASKSKHTSDDATASTKKQPAKADDATASTKKQPADPAAKPADVATKSPADRTHGAGETGRGEKSTTSSKKSDDADVAKSKHTSDDATASTTKQPADPAAKPADVATKSKSTKKSGDADAASKSKHTSDDAKPATKSSKKHKVAKSTSSKHARKSAHAQSDDSGHTAEFSAKLGAKIEPKKSDPEPPKPRSRHATKSLGTPHKQDRAADGPVTRPE